MGNQMETQSKIIVTDFIVDPSQVKLTNWIFQHHPETAVKVKLQNQKLRTTYMNLLFGVIQTLYYKSPHDLSKSEISKDSEILSDLTQVGKNRRASEARIGELEKQVKKLELMMSDVKTGLEKEKAKLKNP
ncbi:MATH domain and coiled-coil domain-containing protein At3g58270-like [Capsella rubella]|uniref:MATH domain and coiled-coil domain-containing protein At3g58270-like n=1 Tax=Capsella rubella TaxID=81985 RepID=UPI000CD5AEF2|nr:MATH domain and coiled-coil domain-containing protein At3g58270-like [Capsella rubella]